MSSKILNDIAQKLLPRLDDELKDISIFKELSTEELLYLADLHGIGKGRDATEISNDLLVILRDIKKAQKYLTEGEQYSFSNNGVDYVINLEYLYEHFIREGNKNIPFTRMIMPDEEIKNIEKKFTESTLEKIKNWKYLYTAPYLQSEYYVFQGYTNLMQYLRDEHNKYLKNFFYTEADFKYYVKPAFFQLNSPTPAVIQVFDWDGKNLKNFEIYGNEPENYKEDSIPEYKTKEYDEIPTLSHYAFEDTALFTDRLAEIFLKRAQNEKIDFILSKLIEKIENGKIDEFLEEKEKRMILDYVMLTKKIFPDLVEKIIELGYDKDIPMYDYCFNCEGVSDTDSFYRSFILFELCKNHKYSETFGQTQLVTTIIPNNPEIALGHPSLSENEREKAVKAIDTFNFFQENKYAFKSISRLFKDGQRENDSQGSEESGSEESGSEESEDFDSPETDTSIHFNRETDSENSEQVNREMFGTNDFQDQDQDQDSPLTQEFTESSESS